MKRFFTAMLLLALLVSMPAAAARAETPASPPVLADLYHAVSCVSDGSDYDCDGEYLELHPDGSGIFLYCGTPYDLHWSLGDEPITYENSGAFSQVWPFAFTDRDGDEFSGYLFPEGLIYGTYRDYEYAFASEALLHAGNDASQSASTDTLYVPTPGYEPSAADEALPYRTFYRGDDYILLNDDGTGVWFWLDEAIRITSWTSEGERIRIEAYDGSVLSGTLANGVLNCGDGYNDWFYTAIPGMHPPATQLAPERWNADLPSVLDEADILTDEQERTLALRADEISRANHCNVYIIALSDYRDYTDAYSLYACDEEIRTGYNLGYGSDKSCICLFLSMNARDYDLLTFGDFASAAFTDYGKSRLESAFLDDFSNDNWYAGLTDYLETCGSLLQSAAVGQPLDFDSDPLVGAAGIAGCVLLAFVPALIFCLLHKRRMQAVARGGNANAYVDGVEFTCRRDQYLRTTTSRRYSPRNSGGSGGGRSGGSRGGHSHRGGKF